MSSQLDILALEPFYGGARKAMLEAVIRTSRHRWTLLKLPPRRIERRLAAAAQWFSEQLSRHWAGRTDMLFTSEAMNLTDLFRLMPQLARKPSVVYFHDNELPEPTVTKTTPLHLVNLTTARAATEIWFNSLWHLRAFLVRASALVDRHPELAATRPMPEITAKAQLMPPPTDFGLLQDLAPRAAARDPRTIFVDTRGADIVLLNATLKLLAKRNLAYRLVTVGPVEGLGDDIARRTVSERDEAAQVIALREAGVYLSTRPRTNADHHAVRALAVGAWPVLPRSGVYPELIPPGLHTLCLYDKATPDDVVSRLQLFWTTEAPDHRDDVRHVLKKFDAASAGRAFDERIEQLVVGHSVR